MPAARSRSRSTRRTPSAGLLLCAVAVVWASSSGCAAMRGFAFRQGDKPYGRHTPCLLSDNPTAEEVIQHVNHTAAKVHGWRANNVEIRHKAFPIPFSGFLYVEQDQRLHLQVTSAIGKEIDFGSNDEHFWVWMGPRVQKQPTTYYASHEDMHLARQHLPLPFEPDWLMEALGVVPISDEGVQLEREPGSAAIRLVSAHSLPDGQTVKKVVVVNACHGYVMEHGTYDAHNKPLVRALLQDYRRDQTTGIVLPHHIRLDWPQADMSLAMDLGHIEVNPPDVNPLVWQMPQVPGTAVVNLGDPRLPGSQYAGGRGPASRRNLMSPSEVKPTVLASGAADLDPAFLPPLAPRRAADDPFETPAIPIGEPEFQPPLVDEPAGRARVGLLPETEAF